MRISIIKISILFFVVVVIYVFMIVRIHFSQQLNKDALSRHFKSKNWEENSNQLNNFIKINNSKIFNDLLGGPKNERQKAVVNALKHAWNGYKRYAWGHDHLKPISMQSSEWIKCGLTIVDSLDTIIIMGLKEEYEEAKEWVENKLNFNHNNNINLFETTIRVLGGLLSAFHLTGESIFLNKSADIGSRLLGALNSPTLIPYSDVNLMNKKGIQSNFNGPSTLSEVATIQLEFRDLSRQTHNSIYEEKTFAISKHLHSIGCSKYEGLCEMFLSPISGKFLKSTITFGARADSYYEYLLKQWLQTGKKINWLIEDYKQAVDSMYKKLWRYSEPNKFGFIGELYDELFIPKMDHLACFMAGTLALGNYHGMPLYHLEIAKNLSRTCFEMYNTTSGLGVEISHFNLNSSVKEDLNIKPFDAHSLLRPEAFEAWFYLFRITGDPIYQEWGWKAFQAIEKHAKVENGYSSVQNANQEVVIYRDMMESFFLAETLKYLYLLFDNNQNVSSFDAYVFNTEGHVLPIYNN